MPATEEGVLEYLELRAAERASRTALASLISSLRFLEETGEVEAAHRLRERPSIQNALREG